MQDDTESLLRRCGKQITSHWEGDDVDWFPLSKIAISVFDRWLGKRNLHLLDCKDGAEREDRNARMLSLWMAMYDSYDILCRSQLDGFAPMPDRSEYEASCAYDGNKETFQCILIPECSAICYENWDDTNVLWFMKREDIVPILQMAEECGLYPIEFAV